MAIEMKKCEECNAEFEFDSKYLVYAEKNPNKAKHHSGKYCSIKCMGLGARTGKNVNCAQCGKEIYKKLCELPGGNKAGKQPFCSHSCSAKNTNANRILTTKGKLQKIVCLTCGADGEVSVHVSKDKFLCKEHTPPPYEAQRLVETDRDCVRCTKTFQAKSAKYCNDCRKIIMKEKGVAAGIASAASQQRRSKNEIAFAEAIANRLNLLIICNEPYFTDKNGGKWDADIIIPDLRLAIHWNGAWHYQEISKKCSLSQIQSRDKIKHSVVNDNGFTNYIVKDLGKHDMKKVEEELIKLKSFLKID